MKINVKEIRKHDLIYPRKNISKITIESYIESMKCGANFPSILIQPIIEIVEDNEEEYYLLIDGLHRLQAFEEYAKNIIDENEKTTKQEKKELKDSIKIEVELLSEERIDLNENLQWLRIESIKRNLIHGDRLSNGDKQQMCRMMAEDDVNMEITQDNFAEIFGVSIGTINSWITDIRTKQTGTRDAIIIKLHRLGWIHEAIGKLIGLTRQAIDEIAKNFNFENFCIDYKNKKKVSDIAEYNGLDELTTWSIILEGKSDIEKFKEFSHKDYPNEQPKMSDYWKFQIGDPRLGLEYPGRTWGNELMNIIYRFSKQGDLVIDPMAGGGVCNDTCLIMNRKCLSFDIKPIREDIIEKDATKSFELTKKADLIFWDPPYYKKLETEYDCKTFTENRKVFIQFIKDVSLNCNKILKKDKYLAFLFSQYIDYNNELDSILGYDYAKIFEENGFKLIIEIQSPLIFSVQYNRSQVEKAKESDPWKILPSSRSWYIFKKVEEK